MNNTDKLLRAFIEASGFEIEEVETHFYKDGELVHQGSIPMYTIIDYKVTKKPEQHWDYCGVVLEPQFTNKEKAMFIEKEMERLQRNLDKLLKGE